MFEQLKFNTENNYQYLVNTFRNHWLESIHCHISYIHLCLFYSLNIFEYFNGIFLYIFHPNNILIDTLDTQLHKNLSYKLYNIKPLHFYHNYYLNLNDTLLYKESIPNNYCILNKNQFNFLGMGNTCHLFYKMNHYKPNKYLRQVFRHNPKH